MLSSLMFYQLTSFISGTEESININISRSVDDMPFLSFSIYIIAFLNLLNTVYDT